MALPLWSQLQKSQDNPETIEQAITRLIGEHEADPEAHLGAGESLSEHKHHEVIDHPAMSIVPDKISTGDLTFETTFESLAGFTKTSNVTNPAWPGAIFDIFDGGGDTATLRTNLEGIIPTGAASKNFLIDIYLYRDSSDDLEQFYIGLINTTFSTRYAGFKVINGELFGFARIGGSEYTTSKLADMDNVRTYFLRVYYDHAANTIYWFINGVQAGSANTSSGLALINNFGAQGLDNGAEGTVIKLMRVMVSGSLY